MRAVDTNIVVRCLTGDEPEQAAKARALIGRQPVFIPRTVLLEAEWVLHSAYGSTPAQIIPALRALAGLPGASIEDAALVARAMDWAVAGIDFADALHLAAAGDCDGFLTFDRRLVRSGRRPAPVQVSEP